MDLKEFYAKELEAGDNDPKPSFAYNEATKKQNTPSQKLLRLGEEHNRVEVQTKQLVEVMEKAKIKENEPVDAPERMDALQALIAQFFKAARVVRVKLMEPILDSEGNALKKFGMKELHEEPERADKQMARLREDFEIAKQFFPDLELKEITSKDNKRVAVLIGADAEEFNAVVTAEKIRQLWAKQTADLNAEMEKTHQEIADQRKVRLAEEQSKMPKSDRIVKAKDTPDTSLVVH